MAVSASPATEPTNRLPEPRGATESSRLWGSERDLAAAGGSRALVRLRQRRQETSAEVVAGTRVSTKKAAVSPRRLVSIPYGLLIARRVGELWEPDTNLRLPGYGNRPDVSEGARK
jgi:hypothetical protein